MVVLRTVRIEASIRFASLPTFSSLEFLDLQTNAITMIATIRCVIKTSPPTVPPTAMGRDAVLLVLEGGSVVVDLVAASVFVCVVAASVFVSVVAASVSVSVVSVSA